MCGRCYNQYCDFINGKLFWKYRQCYSKSEFENSSSASYVSFPFVFIDDTLKGKFVFFMSCLVIKILVLH